MEERVEVWGTRQVWGIPGRMQFLDVNGLNLYVLKLPHPSENASHYGTNSVTGTETMAVTTTAMNHCPTVSPSSDWDSHSTIVKCS